MVGLLKLILIIIFILGLSIGSGIAGFLADKLRKTNVSSCGIVTDIDGNTYNTVQIGSQCWMKENLKVTKNPGGKAITRYCYNNDSKICDTDGGLYDWNTAMNNSTTESAQGICPNGWHVPNNSEWDIMEKSVQGFLCLGKNSRFLCDYVSTKLEKGGSSSFELILAGHYNNGSFSGRGMNAYFLSSTREEGVNSAFKYGGSYTGYTLYWNQSSGVNASVRCLKD